jgi:hypothetical protein
MYPVPLELERGGLSLDVAECATFDAPASGFEHQAAEQMEAVRRANENILADVGVKTTPLNKHKARYGYTARG